MDITTGTDEYFKDVRLQIESFKKDVFNDYEIIAKGTYKEEVVGLKIIIRSTIIPGIENGQFKPENTTKGGVQIKSIGKESHAFVKALAELYKQPEKSKFTIKAVVADTLVLSANEFDITKDKLKIQLTFDAENKKNSLCELYLDLNPTENYLILGEKDQEWREKIVNLFTT